MTEAKATPEKGAARGVVDFGGGLVMDFSDFIAQEGGDVEIPNEGEGNPDNATLEGEQLIKAPPEVAIPVAEKPAEPVKAAEPEPVPDKPAEPETYEFEIRYRGENLKEKLTKEQIINRLQMAKDYTVKTEELAQKRREIEAVQKVTQTPWFKETYEEAIRTGAIEAIPEPPASDPLDKYEYEKRRNDADFAEVQSRMREYALSLPEEAQEILNSNYRVFTKEYDRFAEAVRKERIKPAEPPKVDPEVAKKILQSKEVVKANAAVEKPGVGAPDVDPNIEKRKRLQAIHREAKAGKPGAIQKLAYFSLYGEIPDF